MLFALDISRGTLVHIRDWALAHMPDPRQAIPTGLVCPGIDESGQECSSPVEQRACSPRHLAGLGARSPYWRGDKHRTTCDQGIKRIAQQSRKAIANLPLTQAPRASHIQISLNLTLRRSHPKRSSKNLLYPGVEVAPLRGGKVMVDSSSAAVPVKINHLRELLKYLLSGRQIDASTPVQIHHPTQGNMSSTAHQFITPCADISAQHIGKTRIFFGQIANVKKGETGATFINLDDSSASIMLSKQAATCLTSHTRKDLPHNSFVIAVGQAERQKTYPNRYLIRINDPALISIYRFPRHRS